MTGHHHLKVFVFTKSDARAGTELPTGWKPFSSWADDNFVYVTARKWVREED